MAAPGISRVDSAGQPSRIGSWSRNSFPVQSAPETSVTANIVAWKQHLNKLKPEEKEIFLRYVTGDIQVYIAQASLAHGEQRDQSWSHKLASRFAPMVRIMQKYMSVAAMMSQADPNPSSLVIGGVLCLMNITTDYLEYQENIAAMLQRMARKADIASQLGDEIYKDDPRTHKALIEVFGDVLDFCREAYRLLTNSEGKIRNRWKLFNETLWNQFKTKLGPLVDKFEQDFEHFREAVNVASTVVLHGIQDQVAENIEISQQISIAGQEIAQSTSRLLLDGQQRNLEAMRRREREFAAIRVAKRAEILAWLPNISFQERLDQNFDGHLLGTGQWLLRSSDYLDWKSSETSSLLWVKGKAGSGKSVLASLAVKDLESTCSKDVALGYVFCTSLEENRNQPLTLLRSMVWQLFCRTASINSTVEKLFDDWHELQPHGLTMQQLKAALPSLAAAFQKTYLVFDGMDECENLEDISKFIFELSQFTGSTINILLLSRPEYDGLETVFKDSHKVLVDEGRNETDIEKFIGENLSRLRMLSETDREELNTKLVEKAEGMFLYIRLLFESLIGLESPNRLRRTLNSAPKGLDEMYDRSISRILGDNNAYKRQLALNVLLWTANSKRQMTRDELLEAIVIETDMDDLDDGDRIQLQVSLTTLCGDLIQLGRTSSGNECFSLIHTSLKEFLHSRAFPEDGPLEEYRLQQIDADLVLGELCLTYLLFSPFKATRISSKEDLLPLYEKYPLLDYASENWGLHLEGSGESRFRQKILELVKHENLRNLNLWLRLAQPLAVHDKSNPLHFLALFNLVETAKLIENPQDLCKERDCFQFFPLEYAIFRGHQNMSLWLTDYHEKPKENLLLTGRPPVLHVAIDHGWVDVVNRLVELGYDIDERSADDEGKTAMMEAVLSNNADIVERLLQLGADVDRCDNSRIAPLHWATVRGSKKILELLVAKTSIIAPRCALSGQIPLHFAAENNHDDAIKILHGARSDLNAKCTGGYAPLHITAFHGSTQAAKTLIELGADVSARDDRLRTSLHIAASGGFLEIVKMLYEANNSTLFAKDDTNSTVLHGAASGGKFEVVKFLVENEAPLTAKDADNDIPLHLAIVGGHIQTAKYLLEKNPDTINSRGLSGRTPFYTSVFYSIDILDYILSQNPNIDEALDTGQTALHSSLLHNNIKATQKLLAAGADVTVCGVFGSSTLHYAAHNGTPNVAKLLLDKGVDMNVANEHKQTPLHFAARRGNLDFIIDLFDLPIKPNVNAVDVDGNSALYLAAKAGYTNVVQFLLTQDLKPVANNSGNLALHIAAAGGYEDIVRLLLPTADVDVLGYNGRSPLYFAASGGHLATVTLLRENGASINFRDVLGFSPLMAALASCHTEVAHVLIDEGADINIANNVGQTPLHTATSNVKNLSVTRRLLELGCNGIARNWMGVTPFKNAICLNDIDTVKLFANYGFDQKLLTDDFGSTSLHEAASIGNMEVLDLLLARGQDPNAYNIAGRNPLYYAASQGHLEVAQRLIEEGASLESDVPNESSPLTVAAGAGNYRIVWLLIRQGADIHSVERYTKTTPICDASINRRQDCFKALLNAGSDLFHVDALGFTPFQYACNDEFLLETLLLERDDIYSDVVAMGIHQRNAQEKQAILQATTREALKALIDFPTNLSPRDEFVRLNWVIVLASALASQGKLEFARPLYMECFFPNKKAIAVWIENCAMCNSPPDTIFACTHCMEVRICEECHTQYAKGFKEPKSAPRGVMSIQKLEREMLMARRSVNRVLHWGATTILTLVLTGSDWLDTKIDAYKDAEADLDERFTNQKRPGRDFAHLLLSVRTTIEENAEDQGTKLAELDAALIDLETKNSSDVDYGGFYCSGHEFLRVSKTEHDEMIAVETGTPFDRRGRVTQTWLQGLLQQLEGAADQAPETAATASVENTSSDLATLTLSNQSSHQVVVPEHDHDGLNLASASTSKGLLNTATDRVEASSLPRDPSTTETVDANEASSHQDSNFIELPNQEAEARLAPMRQRVIEKVRQARERKSQRGRNYDRHRYKTLSDVLVHVLRTLPVPNIPNLDDPTTWVLELRNIYLAAIELSIVLDPTYDRDEMEMYLEEVDAAGGIASLF